MKKLKYYITLTGKCPFREWYINLDRKTMARVDSRLVRLLSGNPGDSKKISTDICELRLCFGAGYRIYYTEQKQELIILLSAGDKKTQSKDIALAKKYLQELKGRQNDR